MKFYKCEGCGNFVTFLGEKTGCTPKCCGETMHELVPNTTDAANEKHVPVIVEDGNQVTVTVGSTLYSMDHFRNNTRFYKKRSSSRGKAKCNISFE